MVSSFARILLSWHENNPRPMPWSDGNRNPYPIWLSEIIMQQTRVEQGTSYYLLFLKKFPTIHDLANAPLDDILRLWQGLGYYSRARNLHKTAILVSRNYNGQFPDSYQSLLSLPGIGPYSAAAIASFAFGKEYAVVDGNVKRLIARFNGIGESIDEPATYEKIHQIASRYMKGAPPHVFNQAIMNFGSLVCKPSSPLCDTCPLSTKCYAFKHNLVSVLPVRLKKKPNTVRYFHFIILRSKGKILLRRREKNDIWRELYAPPVIELPSKKNPTNSQLLAAIGKIIGHTHIELLTSSPANHQFLSHQTIIGRFHQFNLLSPPAKLSEGNVWVTKKTINLYGKPKMIVSMIENIQPSLFYTQPKSKMPQKR